MSNNFTKKCKEVYNSIPEQVRYFLRTAFFVFIGWKILYHVFLLPVRFPDKQLTSITTNITAKVFTVIYPTSIIAIHEIKDYSHYDEGIDHSRIFRDGRSIVGVTDGCNGLELYVLYLGFLFCIPMVPIKRVVKYAAIGLPTLFLMNMLRMLALALLHMYYREYFDIAHHYVFKIMMYGLVFYIWMLYVKKSGLSHEENS